MLWRLTPESGGKPSYLFGTMHVRDARAFGWLDLAESCMATCTVFATEFDFSDTDPAAFAAALELPEGKSLKDFLPRNAWKLLDHFAQKKLHSSAEALQFQHPMSVSTLLSAAFFSEEMSHSVDETLWHRARALGMTTTGVETFAEQLDTLGRIPFEQHIKGLTWLLKNHNRQKRRLNKMMKRYAEGEIQTLYQSAKKDAKGMRKTLIYRRNKVMASRFSEIAVEKPLFCAVGAGHLAGGKGILRLLKNAGFKIEPVLPEH